MSRTAIIKLDEIVEIVVRRGDRRIAQQPEKSQIVHVLLDNGEHGVHRLRHPGSVDLHRSPFDSVGTGRARHYVATAEDDLSGTSQNNAGLTAAQFDLLPRFEA